MRFFSGVYHKFFLILLAFIFTSLLTTSDAKENDVVITKNSVKLNGQLLNSGSPVSFGLTHSNELGSILNFHYSRLLNDKNALALGLEAGKRNQRVNLTYGKLWSNKEKIKLTAELLRQKGEYHFSTEDSQEWINQYALGILYKHPAPESLKRFTSLNNISLGAKYVNADSKDLDANVYQAETDTNNLFFTNERQVSGATRKSINVGADFTPRPFSHLHFDLLYDDLRYTDSLNSNFLNFQGLGTNLTWREQLSKKTGVLLSSSFNEAYNRHHVQINHQLGNVRSYPSSVEIGMTHQMGKHGLDDDNRIMVNYNLGKRPASIKTDYQTQNSQKKLSTTDDKTHNALNWVKQPAVYENRVLAIANQKLNTVSRERLITVTKNELTPITLEIAQYFGFTLNTTSKQKGTTPPVSYNAKGLPEGFIIDGKTAIISGTTPEVADGSKLSFPITVIATSTDGNSFTITFTLIVLPLSESSSSRGIVTSAQCSPDNRDFPLAINNVDLGTPPNGCSVDLFPNGSDGIEMRLDGGVIRVSATGAATIDSSGPDAFGNFVVAITAASGRRYTISLDRQFIFGTGYVGISNVSVSQL